MDNGQQKPQQQQQQQQQQRKLYCLELLNVQRDPTQERSNKSPPQQPLEGCWYMYLVCPHTWVHPPILLVVRFRSPDLLKRPGFPSRVRHPPSIGVSPRVQCILNANLEAIVPQSVRGQLKTPRHQASLTTTPSRTEEACMAQK